MSHLVKLHFVCKFVFHVCVVASGRHYQVRFNPSLLLSCTNNSFLSLTHREVDKPKKAVQQAVPQNNHVHLDQNSSQAAEKLHRSDREEPPGGEARYGLEVQLRPSQSAAEDRAERCSPDSAESSGQRNGQLNVIQVTLPPEQNGGMIYQRGTISRADSEKHVQRKNTLAQVERWVNVHKGDPPKRSVRRR